MPHVIPIRDLKDTSSISALCKETKEPIYITKNGYGDMVIMSMDAYERRMALLDVYEKLEEAEDDCEKGRTIDASTSLKRLREKYDL